VKIPITYNLAPRVKSRSSPSTRRTVYAGDVALPVPVIQQSLPSDSQSFNLGHFGYSSSSESNPLSILEKLELSEKVELPTKTPKLDRTKISLTSALREIYILLIRQLPSRNYVNVEVQTFFAE
jgi:hypothetical protein